MVVVGIGFGYNLLGPEKALSSAIAEYRKLADRFERNQGQHQRAPKLRIRGFGMGI